MAIFYGFQQDKSPICATISEMFFGFLQASKADPRKLTASLLIENHWLEDEISQLEHLEKSTGDRVRVKDHKFTFESGLNRYQSSVLMLSFGHVQQAKAEDQIRLNM